MAALSTVLASALAGKTLLDSSNAQSQAKDEAARQKQQQEKLQAEAKKKEQQIDLNKVRDDAKKKMKAQAVGAGGRRDTILTSPLGDVGGAPAAGGKTLLGY